MKPKKNGKKSRVVDVKVEASKGKGRRSSGKGGAAVSYPTRISARATESLKLSGRDRFAHIPNLGQFAAGQLVLDSPLTLAAFPRLSSLANTYQRVRFHRLVFTVCPMSSTQVAGGIASCFIPDASDVVESGNPLSKILATRPGTVSKAWEEKRLVVPRISDLFYTSSASGDPRLYSPGRFAMAIESKVTPVGESTAPVSIYVDWEVELSKPGLESEGDDGLVALTCPGYLILQKDSYGLSVKMKKSDGTFTRSITPNNIFPGIQKGVVYRLPQAVAPFLNTTGQVEENKIGNWEFIRWSVENAGSTNPTEYDRIWFVESDGTAVEVVSKIEQDLLWRPSIVPVGKDFGQSSTGLEFLSHQQKRDGPVESYPPFDSPEPSSQTFKSMPKTLTKTTSTSTKSLADSSKKYLQRLRQETLHLKRLGIDSPEDLVGVPLDSDIEII